MAGSPTPLGEMFSWLAGGDARAAAAAELHRRALPAALVDDVLGAAAVAVAGADLSDVANPVAYARRVVTMKTIDLLRGRIRLRAREVLVGDDSDIGGDAGPIGVDAIDGDPSPFSVVAAEQMEDDLRAALHRLLAGRRPWVAAAGLTTLTLAAHRDVALPRGAPSPDRWAALWLAGERNCFPSDGEVEDAAMRQRRSRALRAVDAVLQEAAAAIGLRVADV